MFFDHFVGFVVWSIFKWLLEGSLTVDKWWFTGLFDYAVISVFHQKKSKNFGVREIKYLQKAKKQRSNCFF